MRVRKWTLSCGVFLALVPVAFADGGHLLTHQASGPFLITLFSAPDPLSVGDADFSVLIQDRATEKVLLDAAIDMQFRSPTGQVQTVHLLRNPTGDKLLESVSVSLQPAGTWGTEIDVQRGAEHASCGASFQVEPGSSRRSTIIVLMVLPLIVIGLFLVQRAYHGRVSRRRTLQDSLSSTT